MATKEIKVPNIGGATNVEIIEIMVCVGDRIKKDDSLVTLESDKASMEIPAPQEGIVESLAVKVGDKVSEGSLILTLKIEKAQAEEKTSISKAKEPAAPEKASSATKGEEKAKPAAKAAKKEVRVPNIGSTANVEVIEVMVSEGDRIKKDDSLITLESDKASMEIPAPQGGIVESLAVKVGDKVSEGSLILTLKVDNEEKTSVLESEAPVTLEEKASSTQTEEKSRPVAKEVEAVLSDSTVHAGPAVRRMARELGVDLSKITGSGPKNRILTEDLQKFVKSVMKQSHEGGVGGSGLQVAKMPEIDFSQFGEIESLPLNKIKKLTGIHVHRSWVTIPHVTQFDEADITDLEEFRKAKKDTIEKQGIKLTPLVFIMKAVVAALKRYPHFNASLEASGENLILKKYYNLGIAVDTPNGLVVPVIKAVDKKGMVELAQELAAISRKARETGLSPLDMAGSCFTISSLGGIGGTAFTPIVNGPDVAILGVSKASIKPIYERDQFVPRLMLPLSLSYDHRVIDGADGARFLAYLANCLSDIRTLLL